MNFSKSIERGQTHTVHCVDITQFLIFWGIDFIPLVGEFPIISWFGLNFQKRTTKLAILHRLGLGLGLCPNDRETRFSGNVKLVNFTRRVAFTDTIIFTYLDGEIPIISNGEFACIQYQLLLIWANLTGFSVITDGHGIFSNHLFVDRENFQFICVYSINFNVKFFSLPIPLTAKHLIFILVKVQLSDIGFVDINSNYIRFDGIVLSVNRVRHNAIELACT